MSIVMGISGGLQVRNVTIYHTRIDSSSSAFSFIIARDSAVPSLKMTVNSRKQRPFVGDIHHLDEIFGTIPLNELSRTSSWLSKTCLLLKIHYDGDSW